MTKFLKNSLNKKKETKYSHNNHGKLTSFMPSFVIQG